MMNRAVGLTMILILAALAAMPSLAQKLPAPEIVAINIGEIRSVNKEQPAKANVRNWCITVAWRQAPGAASDYLGSDRSWEDEPGYAIRLWRKGGRAPKLVTNTYYSLDPTPLDAKWTPIRYYWTANVGADVIAFSYCGYDEKQTIRVRALAIDENGKNGKKSKIIKVKLPKFGKCGRPTDANKNPGDGCILYGDRRY